MMKKIALSILGILLLLGIVFMCNEHTSNKLFTTPESTVETYFYAHETRNLILVNESLYKYKYKRNNIGKYWKWYKIKAPIKFTEQRVIEYQKSYVKTWSEKYVPRVGDVEIEVIIEPERDLSLGEPINTYFLLRKIRDNWKIITYNSRIE